MTQRGRKISDMDDDFYKDFKKYNNLVSLHHSLLSGIDELQRNREMLEDVHTEAFFIEDVFASKSKSVITLEFRAPRTGRTASCLNSLGRRWLTQRGTGSTRRGGLSSAH